ncbi:ribonuclease H domain-containing protein [Tanacetum coccineum]
MQMYLSIQGEVEDPAKVVKDIKGQKISKMIRTNSDALMLTTKGKSQDMPLPLCRAASNYCQTRKRCCLKLAKSDKFECKDKPCHILRAPEDYEAFKVMISREMEGDVVELLALIEGLNTAVELGIKRVHILCDNHSVYQYLIGVARPTNNTIMNLVNDFLLILEKFSFCFPFLVSQNSFKFAYNLAREAVASQTTKYAESGSHKTMALLEQCTICFESIHSGQMLYIKKCLHRYCLSCMRKHVEAKLLQGQLPECPHENCKSKLQTESCSKFLDPELYHLMRLRIKEASIPPTEKVYCPFSNCSALMSKTEVKKHTATSSYKRSGMRKCVKCQRCFCINCKVAWHDNITCNGYMKHYQSGNEAKFECLASWQRWRQCINCKHMVELAEGCYHVTCKCGFEFCYNCGSQWLNKKQTCKCRIWDLQDLIHPEQIGR